MLTNLNKDEVAVEGLSSIIEEHAAALKQIGVLVIKSLNKKGIKTIAKWVKNGQPIKVYYPDQTQYLVDQLLKQYIQSIEVEIKNHQWVIPKFVKMG